MPLDQGLLLGLFSGLLLRNQTNILIVPMLVLCFHFEIGYMARRGHKQGPEYFCVRYRGFRALI